MRINRAELADLGTFLTIARHRSFRRAGLELGVSASALSHALKAMETRLGVRLLNRTSRSVTLTAAGEDLLASLDAPFAAIGSALDILNQHREPTKATGASASTCSNMRARCCSPLCCLSSTSATRRSRSMFACPTICSTSWRPEPMRASDTAELSRRTWWRSACQPICAGWWSALQLISIGMGRPIIRATSQTTDACAHPPRGDSLYRGRVREEGRGHRAQRPRRGDPSYTQFALVARSGEWRPRLPPGGVCRPLGRPRRASRSSWQTRAPLTPDFHLYYPGRRQLPTGLQLLIDLIREAKPLGW